MRVARPLASALFARSFSGAVVFVLAAGAFAAFAAGCKKPSAADVAAESVITEETDDGTIAWDIEPDGHVQAIVKGKDGTVLSKDVAGTVTWPGDVADEERDLKLEDGKLVTLGPALKDGLNEIDYALDVGGKVWQGVLHVPGGGTAALEEDAKVDAANPIPPGKVGPNGGVIQSIHGEPVEIVADRDSQEVRFYVLNRDYAVVDPGERTIRLGYGADAPGVELLVREPGAMYWVGPWYAGYNPYRVTIGMTVGGVTHVGILGWGYGSALRVGVAAPPVVGFVGARAWAPSAAVGVGVNFGVGFGVGVGVGGRARTVVAARSAVGVGVGGHVGGGVGVGGHIGGEVGGHVGGEVGGRAGETAGRPGEPAGGHVGGEPGGHEAHEPAGGRAAAREEPHTAGAHPAGPARPPQQAHPAARPAGRSGGGKKR